MWSHRRFSMNDATNNGVNICAVSTSLPKSTWEQPPFVRQLSKVTKLIRISQAAAPESVWTLFKKSSSLFAWLIIWSFVAFIEQCIFPLNKAANWRIECALCLNFNASRSLIQLKIVHLESCHRRGQTKRNSVEFFKRAPPLSSRCFVPLKWIWQCKPSE